MIGNSTIEAVKNSMSIVDVVQDFLKLKKEGSDYVALCPFHDEKTPSFKISPSKNIYKCFGCGKSGDAISFLMEYEKISYLDAIKRLGEKYKVDVDDLV